MAELPVDIRAFKTTSHQTNVRVTTGLFLRAALADRRRGSPLWPFHLGLELEKRAVIVPRFEITAIHTGVNQQVDAMLRTAIDMPRKRFE